MTTPAHPADPATPAAPERNLLRALHPATTEIHKALQRLLLQSGGQYRHAPQVHDYDIRPYVMTNPLRELTAKTLLVFPWDAGTGQTLAEFVAYYKLEIPRRQPLTIVVTASEIDAKAIAAAEALLESPVCVLQLAKADPNRLTWIGSSPVAPAIAALADKKKREALREVDPADAIEAFHHEQPKDASRSIESNLVIPRHPSAFYSYSLILINVAVYILAVIKSAKSTGQWDWDATPVLDQLSLSVAVAQGEWWRLFSCGFMHIGLFHLGMNMMFLHRYGPITESIFGRTRFLALYLLSHLGCALLSFSIHVWRYESAHSAGASGALMGLFFSITGYAVAVRSVIGRGRFKELLRQSLMYAGIMLALGFLITMDNAGHLGGGLAGFGIGYCYGLQSPIHPRWLVRLRYLFLTLFFGLFAGLFWLALPRAASMAQIDFMRTTGGRALMEFWSDYGDLVEATRTRINGPPLYAKYDQVAAEWQQVHSLGDLGAGAEYFGGSPALRPAMDRFFSTLRVRICQQELDELTLEEIDLIKASRSAHPPVAAEMDATRSDLLTRLAQLNAWPVAQQVFRESAALRREAKRLQTDLETWQKTGEPPEAPPAPSPPPSEPLSPDDGP